MVAWNRWSAVLACFGDNFSPIDHHSLGVGVVAIALGFDRSE